jgi:hypothetical protein
MSPLDGWVDSVGEGPAYVTHQFVGVTADVGALSSNKQLPWLVAPVLSQRRVLVRVGPDNVMLLRGPRWKSDVEAQLSDLGYLA